MTTNSLMTSEDAISCSNLASSPEDAAALEAAAEALEYYEGLEVLDGVYILDGNSVVWSKDWDSLTRPITGGPYRFVRLAIVEEKARVE